MDKIQCPICGKMIDPVFIHTLDNGNPACELCVSKEQEHED